LNPKASTTLNQEFSSPVSEPKHDSGLHPFEDLNPISLHQVVEVQAQYNPNATALSMNGQEMSYRLLNSRANQVAHQLRALGVKPGDLVALCFERSFEMIVAILGALKAGGAYLPLDSGYPVQRLRFMIEDARPRVILTSGSHAGLSDSVPELQQLRIDDPAIDSRPTTDGNAPCIDRHHPAYVIYTSGSTGNPKGVPISHHQVLRLFSSTDAWFHFGPGDVWTLFHSYAFDFSVWEIWGALLYGGKLVIVPRETSRNPSEFLKLTLREKVTVLNQTPSAFRQFIWADAGLKPNPADEALRLVIFGGEALELQSLRPWYERHGDQRPVLVNMYGITETTVHVTYRPISKADVDARKGSVIGVPIPDLQVHLLDQNLRPVPRGTPGEICVGGDGVASGYLNREALTRARFIPNPFSNRKEDRLYRSGDLARVTPDGELEYLGRIDDQVKIRGFRVELGEIESHLNQIPGVKGSVVQAVETEGHQEKVLVGYVAVEGTFQVARLRRELERRLPSHMIPGIFVRIDEIPLTINGKVDRKALPWPFNRPELSTEFAPPANEVEARLCHIWSRVLEIPQVGVCDNFFELGGDSIRSIRIVSEAGQEGIHFTSWDLFHHKTVRALTGKCLTQTSRDQNQEKASEPFALVTPEDRSRLPDGLQDAYPATRLQAGMLFHSEFNPRSAVFHDIFSFLIHQRFEEIPMREALTRLVGRHEILRTSFELGKYSHPLQLVHPQISVPLSYENLSHKTTVEQESCLIRWIEEEKRNPLDWNRPPLLRFHAQMLSESSFQFIVSFHHAILDGWSLAAMLTEIFQDYSSLLHHEPIRTATPAIRFREYVRLEREAIENQEHKDFWLEKLQNPTLATLPRWPRVYRDGGLEQRRGPEVPIPDELFAGMKALSHRLEVPLRPLLLAAHYRVLQVLTGVDDLITGLVLNGRPEDHDGEKMIGLFLNTVPLRVRLNGGTWAELIRQCFEAEQETIPHRRFPLAEIQQLHGNRLLFETALDFVHFHVYRDLEGYHGDGVSEGHYFEANNFIFFPTFMMNAPSTALQMHIDYDPEQIAWDQVNLICPYYINCLASMVREPERKYVSFSPLEKKERKTVVYSWNETARNFPEADCIHHFFERNARENPSAIAVRSARGQLSYQEVDQEAEQVAHFLRSRGIGQGSLVAVHLKRTIELVPALLGVLKAGAAYVPVDSHLPDSRVHWLLNETGAEALIAHSDKVQTILNTRMNLPGLAHILVMNEDGQASRIPEELRKQGGLMAKAVAEQELPPPSPQELHTTRVQPSDLAYIIFTSGSTGTPKGVMVKHQPVCNLIDWVNQEFKVSARDQLLFVTSPAFDLSVYDVFGILAAGGVVRIASEEESRDPEMLLDILNRESITFWDSAPAALQQLVPYLGGIEHCAEYF
jgi:amino acid adenylation domain-containing protein